MPPTNLQSFVLRTLASQRSPDSHSAGRIDIFQDSEHRLAAAVLAVTIGKVRTGKRQARVEGLGETMRLEWVADSDFRFFPAQKDDLFGHVLHPIDLATNKASAAAVGRFPGSSPKEMLADIVRHSRFTVEEFRALATETPLDVPGLHRRIRNMIEDAERFIARLPSADVGFVFLDGEKPVQPDAGDFAKYTRGPGSRRGIWPTSPEISGAMLERYRS